MYTAFHIEVTTPQGKVIHAATRVGGGTMTGEQLAEHFRKHRRFTRAKSIKITPIDGSLLPMDITAAVNPKVRLDQVEDPEIQLADAVTLEQLHKLYSVPPPQRTDVSVPHVHADEQPGTTAPPVVEETAKS